MCGLAQSLPLATVRIPFSFPTSHTVEFKIIYLVHYDNEMRWALIDRDYCI